ncbi:MAG: hypothetical protein ATN33_06555 [Epulopiscium sp. Nele67-Bin001]|nr:MAG: hypothetical protein ATN33_06555 [Epulopiscium sp. Nele67-Bin001]
MVKLMSSIVCCAIIPICSVFAQEPKDIIFNDVALKNGLLEAVEDNIKIDANEDGEIDTNEISRLTKLKLDNVEDLTILEYTPNLTKVNLNLFNFEDFPIVVSALAQLPNLTDLTIWGNTEDLGPLANLTNLTSLVIASNDISDISALSNLVNLTNLTLMSTKVSEVSALSNLVNLIELDLYSNQISDISPLEELINLVELNLYDNKISDVSALGSLTNLISLNIANNQIKDISELINLPNLMTLNMLDNPIDVADPDNVDAFISVLERNTPSRN